MLKGKLLFSIIMNIYKVNRASLVTWVDSKFEYQFP